MNNIFRNIIRALFLVSVVMISLSYAYKAEKGKIDMHGGKSDKLTSENAFSMAIGIGKVLNKKGSDKEIEKEEKKFIKIDKLEDIKNDD